MRLICCALLAFVTASAVAADVYRSVDENGQVVYSDRPEGEAERIFVATQRPASRPQPSQPATQAPEPSTTPEVLNGEIVRGPSPEEVAAERSRNCEIARERAERYRVSRRLFRNLPDGEREYLSDAEMADARASADADVGRWCD